MSKIKYSLDLMKYIQVFESLTRAKVKDCISNDQLIFIVDENEIGKAIGRGGSNVRRLESLLKKRIKIAEFSPEVTRFVKNLILPIRAGEIDEEGGTITIKGPDSKTKGLLIGRESRNLNNLKEIVKRHFDIEDIKVA
ncbi:NusA-like transcription termination signal-binding factor [Candidatus Woesearchaeota archaeon]|nr:NusA-like transcription termination signal-binding factor [Candidatus Woesearchaeota archaeon]